MPGTLTEALDNLYTTTWQNMKDTVRDQIFDATPFWFWMKDKGKMEEVAGGRFITEPLNYAKNDSVEWIGKGGTVSMNDKEILTIAKYDWRYLVGNIVRFGVDDQQNRGKNAIMSLMNAKLDNMQNALVDTLETQLFAGSGAATNAMDGLQFLVADDPTTAAAPGGIAQDTYSWWRNTATTMTSISFATSGISKMRTMHNTVSNNLRMDTPDIILSGQTPYEYYEDEGLSYYQTQNNKMLDMGFAHQVFKGIPMVWSPACANTRMYFLNTNFLKFVYDPIMFFDMTEWKAIPDQVNDRAAQTITACQLTSSRLRCQGVLHTIDTA